MFESRTAKGRQILIDLPEHITTERIVLRPWRDVDAPDFYELVDRSREHISRWLPWTEAYHSVDDALGFMRKMAGQWILRGEFALGLFDRSGQLLGSVGLHPRDWAIPSFEIGYWIGAPFEGKGYVTEAVGEITRFALDVLHANRIVIRADAENYRSQNVARRCGYAFEGTFRSDHREPDGRLRDTMFFAVTRRDPPAHGGEN
jgi:RimJ/RimL family protein N-acetyltransferase